jgi:protein-disulfide isomerase
VKGIARLAGLTTARITECVESKDLETQILNMRSDAERQFKIDSTPSFVINGKRHVGPPSFAALDRALKPIAKR